MQQFPARHVTKEIQKHFSYTEKLALLTKNVTVKTIYMRVCVCVCALYMYDVRYIMYRCEGM